MKATIHGRRGLLQMIGVIASVGPGPLLAASSSASLETAIHKAMARSAAAWSAGDLDAFMAVYEDSPETVYVSGTRRVKGKAEIRAMYAERFGSVGAGSLGMLSFDLDEIRALGASYAFVAGRYRLHGPAADKPDATGVFTVVFHHSRSGWHIVADHSA